MSASLGSRVSLPSLSNATPSGIWRPAVCASSSPNHGKPAVAWSMRKVPWSVGTAHVMGLVPRMGCFAPCGATNSGDVANTSPMRPCAAIFSA